MPLPKIPETLTSRVVGFVPWALLAYGAAMQLWILIQRFDQPLAGMFHFRETQTALSAYWLTQGGPKFIYETPVLGAPYTTPFEFPLYQWLVAAVSQISGLGIDQSGRVVSILCFAGILGVSFRIARQLDIPARLWALFAGLLCLSPLYLYWSSTVLIESLALLLALLWLSFFVGVLRDQRVVDAVLAIVFGVLAALVKITTFPPAVMVGFALTVVHFWPAILSLMKSPSVVIQENGLHAALLLSTVVIPIAAVTLWIDVADAAKSQSVFSEWLTSSNLKGFNFGSLSQRLSETAWRELIWERIGAHTLGAYAFAILLLAAGLLRGRRLVWGSAILIIAFLSAPLLFWRLHENHYYYQYANAIFLVAAAAFTFHSALQRRVYVGLAVLTLSVFGMHRTFDSVYSRDVTPQNFSYGVKAVEIGEWMTQNTAPNETLVVFDRDWSSVFHHYAKRKGVAVPARTPIADIRALLSDPERYLAGERIGALVLCGVGEERFADANKPEGERRIDVVLDWIGDREPDFAVRDCRLYRARAA